MKRLFSLTFFTFCLLILPNKSNCQENEKPIKLEFNEFSIEFEYFDIYSADGEFQKITEDSIVLELDLGANFENKSFKILNCEFEIFEINQRFETSVTAMNEGPHIDLINWKHYYSKWKNLKKVSENTFKTLNYKRDETEKFIDVDVEDARLEIKKNGGVEWYEHVKTAKSVHDYPFGVSLSRYYLEIILLDKEKNIKIRKVITINVPMGC